jgi:type I restriction-modification system DNA methylase subunit
MNKSNAFQIKEELMASLQSIGVDKLSIEKKALFKIIELLFSRENIQFPKTFNFLDQYKVNLEIDIENYFKQKVYNLDLSKQYLPEFFCEYFNAEEKKKSHGEVFTPKEVIDLMICRSKEFLTFEKSDICDYASGNGAILYNLTQQTQTPKSITGIDIQPFSCLLGYANIALSKKPLKGDFINLDTIIDRDQLSKKYDILISNPPYMGQKNNQELFEPLKKHSFWNKFYESKSDYQYFFIIQALELLKPNGITCLITTQYWLTATKGNTLRKYITDNSEILEVHDFGTMKLFPNAGGQENVIILLRKKSNSKKATLNKSFPRIEYNKEWIEENSSFWTNKELVCKHITRGIDDVSNVKTSDKLANFSLVSLTENEKNGAPWYFDKTSQDKITEVANVRIGDYFNIQPGIQTGSDKVNKKNKFVKHNLNKLSKLGYNLGDGIYIVTEEELKNLELEPNEKRIIYPFYKVGELNSSGINRINKQYLIDAEHIDDINQYPNIKQHLTKFKDILEVRFKTYALINNEKLGKWWKFVGARPNIPYRGEKLISPSRAKEPFFLYSNSEFFSSMDIFYTYSSDIDTPFSLKFICAYLNSDFIINYLKRNCKKKGIKYELYKDPLSNIPIPDFNYLNDRNCKIAQLIGGVYSVTKKRNYKLNKVSNTWIQEQGLYDYLLSANFKLSTGQLKNDSNELGNNDIKYLNKCIIDLCLPTQKHLNNFNSVNYMINKLSEEFLNNNSTKNK